MPMAALGEVPEADWPAVRLAPGRALRLLALEHDVHALAKAVVAGAPWPSTAPVPAWVAVWREGRDIWRMALSETAHAVLSALVRGATLGEALDAIPEDCGEDVMRWFGAWVSSGFFAGFEVAAR
jgi:hypothetical protein